MRKTIAFSMILMLLSTFMLPAQAAMVGTDQVIHQQGAADGRAKLNAFLDRDEVKQKLISMGVSPEQVKDRVSTMTNQEVAEINQNIDQMPAGGDVLGILLVVFIVFVVTDVLGATDIFPFIKPIK